MDNVMIPSLADYGITSDLGFLPAEPCLERLPHAYYVPWEEVVSNLPYLHKKQLLRAHIERLPVLIVSRLESAPEWRRAYVCLVFILHGYIWGGSQPRTIIPPCISIPLLAICTHLEVPPIATFAGLCLWNYRTIQPNEPTYSPENFMTTATFTGEPDEEWFYLISVAIEARGAPLIPLMLRAISATHVSDVQTVTECLSSFCDGLQELGGLLDRIYERCRPAVFYHRLRPFLAGTKSLEQYGLPDGVYFDDDGTDSGFGSGKLQSYRGGSNAQSSLIQFFDIVLGVEHPAAATGQQSFHEEMREYMPGPHRRFLADISSIARVGEFVQARQQSHLDLLAAYKASLEMLTKLRAKHLRIVSHYIIKEGRRGNSNSNHGHECSGVIRPGSSTEAVDQKFLGTGGTDLIPFLKKTIDESAEPLRKMGVHKRPRTMNKVAAG